MKNNIAVFIKTMLVCFLMGTMTPLVAQKVKHSNEVSAASGHSEPGTIRLKSTGYGSNLEKATNDGLQAAFRTLLFQGVPGTAQRLAMVSNEDESRKTHEDFYTTFLDDGGYKTFILSSSMSGGLEKVKGAKKQSLEVTINVDALRKHLEQNNIVKPFGY